MRAGRRGMTKARHAAIKTLLENAEALRWPLTSKSERALLALIRWALADAEGYLIDGELDAASAALDVAESALPVVHMLHAYETLEI